MELDRENSLSHKRLGIAELAKLRNVDFKSSGAELEREGCVLFEGVVDHSMCGAIKSFMDSYSAQDTEINYSGTEIRIWDAQKKDPLLNEFFDLSRELIERLLNRPQRPKTLLAIRNLPIQVEDKSLYLGRWHLDSFFRQYKVFLFLSDTAEESGPFEFVPGSHADTFKLKMLLRGEYLSPSDLVKKQRRYQSLRETLVDELAVSGKRPKPVICSAGTLMVVNTSAIHRARPCRSGVRYALTAYYV